MTRSWSGSLALCPGNRWRELLPSGSDRPHFTSTCPRVNENVTHIKKTTAMFMKTNAICISTNALCSSTNAHSKSTHGISIRTPTPCSNTQPPPIKTPAPCISTLPKSSRTPALFSRTIARVDFAKARIFLIKAKFLYPLKSVSMIFPIFSLTTASVSPISMSSPL